jgi:hypothetical protein
MEDALCTFCEGLHWLLGENIVLDSGVEGTYNRLAYITTHL